jgi:hypothetical protein
LTIAIAENYDNKIDVSHTEIGYEPCNCQEVIT